MVVHVVLPPMKIV